MPYHCPFNCTCPMPPLLTHVQWLYVFTHVCLCLSSGDLPMCACVSQVVIYPRVPVSLKWWFTFTYPYQNLVCISHISTRECDWSHKSHVSKDVWDKFCRCCWVRLLIMLGVTQYRSVKSAYFSHYVQSLFVDMNYVRCVRRLVHMNNRGGYRSSAQAWTMQVH